MEGRLESLNESPSEKEGKYAVDNKQPLEIDPSMKVPPKRKGNSKSLNAARIAFLRLNESPSEKEGKWYQIVTTN